MSFRSLPPGRLRTLTVFDVSNSIPFGGGHLFDVFGTNNDRMGNPSGWHVIATTLGASEIDYMAKPKDKEWYLACAYVNVVQNNGSANPLAHIGPFTIDGVSIDTQQFAVTTPPQLVGLMNSTIFPGVFIAGWLPAWLDANTFIPIRDQIGILLDAQSTAPVAMEIDVWIWVWETFPTTIGSVPTPQGTQPSSRIELTENERFF